MEPDNFLYRVVCEKPHMEALSRIQLLSFVF